MKFQHNPTNGWFDLVHLVRFVKSLKHAIMKDSTRFAAACYETQVQRPYLDLRIHLLNGAFNVTMQQPGQVVPPEGGEPRDGMVTEQLRSDVLLKLLPDLQLDQPPMAVRTADLLQYAQSWVLNNALPETIANDMRHLALGMAQAAKQYAENNVKPEDIEDLNMRAFMKDAHHYFSNRPQ